LDCSAFVQKVFSIFGIDLPRTAREQFQVGYEVAREALRMGDLVFFKRSKTPRPIHVGIYIGDGRFIHTSLRKRRVDIDSMDSRYFATRFIGAKRIEEVKRPPETEELIRNSALPEE
jgi:cell wall-associated NlpC family hydrolase